MAGDRDRRLGAPVALGLLDRVDEPAARLGAPAPAGGGRAAAAGALPARVRRGSRPSPVGARGARALAVVAAIGCAGCDGALSVLDPAGPAAAAVVRLWWAMFAGAVALVALVAVLGALAFAKRRPRVSTGVWIHGLGIGLGTTVVGALAVAGVVVGERLRPAPAPGVVRVEAIAHRFSWRFVQPGPDGAPLATEGRLYVPAGTPIDVVVRSADVIHSFWVPRLAGKMDAVPGRANVLRLRADAPGTYAGQCAEYCGTGHAGMTFELIAYPPGRWPADAPSTRAPADDPTDRPVAAAGVRAR